MFYEDYLKPKKVLMTADTIGGVWTYALELSRALAPYGVRVHLATMGQPLRDGQRHEAEQIENLEIYESHYKLEWMDDPWQDITEAGVWLLRLEERIRPDIVHINGYAHGSLPWRSPSLIVAHSCVISWWEAVHGEQAPSSWDRYYREVARGLTTADMVAAPSMAMFWNLTKHYGPVDSGRIIYNGRTAALFRPAGKERFILTAGRLWDKAKNLSLLEAAAGRLPWPVFAAGMLPGRSGESRSECVRRNGITPLGELSRPELSDWFGRASIFVLPAKYEPFGLSILEAALSGCALVLGDIPSLRELWNGAALFVRPDDANGLQEQVMSLTGNESFRREMSSVARERALLYTPATMAAGYYAAYRELAEGWHTASLFQPARGLVSAGNGIVYQDAYRDSALVSSRAERFSGKG